MYKKLIVLVLLVHSVSAKNPSHMISYLKQLYNQKVLGIPQQPEQIKPSITIVELNDPIDFKKKAEELIAVAKDSSVHGVLLVVDCGGGAYGSFSVLHDLIKKTGTIKPVVALITGGALSCGYIIASAAHYIIAHSVSNIGFIGVKWEVMRYLENPLLKNGLEVKYKVEPFYAGRYKNLFNEHAQKLTPEEKKYMQSLCDKTYQHAIKTIAENRGLDRNKSHTWAEAQWFFGFDALQVGLIDEVGTAFEAEQALVRLVKEKNPDISFASEVTYKKG